MKNTLYPRIGISDAEILQRYARLGSALAEMRENIAFSFLTPEEKGKEFL